MTPSSDAQLDRRDVAETGRDRLQRAADGGGHHERRGALPGRDAAQHLEPATHGLGTRAEPFVRQRLPRGEVHDLGAGQQRFERRTERFGAATGGRDDEQRTCTAGGSAALEQRGQERGVEALDEREVRIHGCCGCGIPERVRLFEGAHDPGNCHRTSLRAPVDTRLARPERIGARLVG